MTDTNVVDFTRRKRRKRTDAPLDATGQPGPMDPRVEAFCSLLVAESLTQAEAYRRAFDVAHWTPEAVHVEASRLAATPNVRLRIDELKRRAMLETHAGAEQMRRMIASSLLHIADTADRAADRLKALEMLGRLAWVRAFDAPEERPPQSLDHLTADEVEARLKQRLRELAER